MQTEIASIVGQLQGEESLGLVRLPKPQCAAAPSSSAHDEASRVEGDTPASSLEALLGRELLLGFASSPVQKHHQRLADAGERVGYVRNASTCEQGAVHVEGHAADAADVGTEAGVVLVQ